MSEIDEITRAVARQVGQRLGQQDSEVMEVVIREVVAAVTGARDVPPSSSAAPLSPPTARDNGDGTVTTALGAVMPMPAAGRDLDLCAGCSLQNRVALGSRAVVTTTGKNKRGVLAAVAAQVAQTGGDIQEVSQTIIAEYFTTIMVVDVSQISVAFSEFKERLVARAGELGVHAVVIHEDVLHALQRV